MIGVLTAQLHKHFIQENLKRRLGGDPLTKPLYEVVRLAMLPRRPRPKKNSHTNPEELPYVEVLLRHTRITHFSAEILVFLGRHRDFVGAFVRDRPSETTDTNELQCINFRP